MINSDWFNASVKHSCGNPYFRPGCVAHVSVLKKHVRVMTASGSYTMNISLAEAKACLESIRDTKGAVIFHSDQESTEENWQVAAGLVE